MVIGEHDRPRVRLVGGIAAPDHAAHAKNTIILMPQERRAFVERLDFVTSLGFGADGRERARLGLTTAGPTTVITDLCLLARPHLVDPYWTLNAALDQGWSEHPWPEQYLAGRNARRRQQEAVPVGR